MKQIAGGVAAFFCVVQARLLHLYFTESVYKVVLHKSIPAQIRQLFFILAMIKDKLTNLCGN